MPPVLPRKDQSTLLAQSSPKKRRYIEGLYHRYGLARQTPCGVHVNVSLNDEVLAFIQAHFPDRFESAVVVRNAVYPLIAQGFIQYRWLLTYLFGASPVAQANYFANGAAPEYAVRSLRQSSYGYPTSFEVDYTSVAHYVDKITTAVASGKIMSIAEFYGAVRFKGSADLHRLVQNGVRYLELRMFDLNPTSSTAITADTLRLIRMMMIYFALAENPFRFDGERANHMNNQVALEAPDQQCTFKSEALAFLNQLREVATELSLGPEYLTTLDHAVERVNNPQLTVSGQLNRHIKDGSLLDYGITKAQSYQAEGLKDKSNVNPFVGNDGHLSTTELQQALFDKLN